MGEVLVIDFPTFLVFALLFVLVYRFVKPRVFPASHVHVAEVEEYALPPSEAVAEETVVGRVSHLWLYPLKSAAGVAVEQATLGERGFEGDRQLMLVRENEEDEEGPLSFVSLRNVPNLAKVTARRESGQLVVVCEGEELRVDVPKDTPSAEAVSCRLWDDVVDCTPVSREADEWFSRRMGKPLRLMRIAGPYDRRVPPKRRDPEVSPDTSMADGYPYLLATSSSLQAVRRQAGAAVEMQRFRPNIVVQGERTAFEEDSYAELRIGQHALFRNLKCCERCKVPRLALGTGVEAADGQPTKAIMELGHCDDKDAFFGVNLAHVRGCEGAVVRVGDSVVLTRRYVRSLMPERSK